MAYISNAKMKKEVVVTINGFTFIQKIKYITDPRILHIALYELTHNGFKHPVLKVEKYFDDLVDGKLTQTYVKVEYL